MNIDELNLYLQKESDEICRMNGCTEDEHHCESYAYIDVGGSLLDICYPDYFQGTGEPYSAIALPWFGTDQELEDEIVNQCWGDIDHLYEPERTELMAELENRWGIIA